MARPKITSIDHGPRNGTWPNGEKPSGWPGTDPSKNVRDLYDEIESGKSGKKGR